LRQHTNSQKRNHTSANYKLNPVMTLKLGELYQEMRSTMGGVGKSQKSTEV